MNSNKNSFTNFLFSIGGVLAMFVLLAGIYVIVHLSSSRIDMTEGNLYTLSSGTRAILKKLDTPVQIRFYATQGRDMPLPLKTYAQRVEDLLNEYRKAAPGLVQIKKFDPQPDSDAEDKAIFDGVEGQQINMGDKIYLGIAINMLDATEQIPFLTPQRERLLEYDLTRAIANVMNTKKPLLGVMSGLPVFGQQMNPMMMMQMGRQPNQEPWVFISELKKDFQVREIPITADKIDDDINMLMVFHPKGITDNTLFAIDQFVLRGGKLLGFVDPFSIVDAQSAPQNNPLQAAASGGSTLEKLTKAWGLEYDGNKVLADTVFMSKINRGRGPENAPAVLSLTEEGINTNDVVTAQVDNISVLFSGAFSGTPAAGLTQTILLHSSPQSQLVEKFMAQFSGDQILKDFVPSNKEYAIALRLTGKFKTAFPEGKPKETAAGAEGEDTRQSDNSSTALKESAKDGAVILVADTDLLYDAFAAQVQQLFGQKLIFPVNGNLNLAQSMVEQMGGDENLIAIRSRATMNRPFTRIKQVEAAAEDKYRSTIKDLEKSLADAQTRLNELQQTKESGQRFILSPEQQAEIRNFQEKQVEVRKQLKEVRKNLRRDIESMENKLKWTNILAMPFVVVAAGMVVAAFKRKRTAAR